MFSRQASWKRHRRMTFCPPDRPDRHSPPHRPDPAHGLGLRPVCALSCSAANDISTALWKRKVRQGNLRAATRPAGALASRPDSAWLVRDSSARLVLSSGYLVLGSARCLRPACFPSRAPGWSLADRADPASSPGSSPAVLGTYRIVAAGGTMTVLRAPARHGFAPSMKGSRCWKILTRPRPASGWMRLTR